MGRFGSVVDARGHRFEFLSWFLLYDLDEQLNRVVAHSFGICPEFPPDPPKCTEFLAWQGSFALCRNDSGEKRAWPVWKDALGR